MDFTARLQSKYTWFSESDAQSIVDRAKMFYYNLSYPADKFVDEYTHPIVGFRNEQWILAACDEIVERLGFSSAIAYKENGISFSFDNCHLSKFLIAQLPPVVGVVK